MEAVRGLKYREVQGVIMCISIRRRISTTTIIMEEATTATVVPGRRRILMATGMGPTITDPIPQEEQEEQGEGMAIMRTTSTSCHASPLPNSWTGTVVEGAAYAP